MAHDELDNQLDPLEGDTGDPRSGPAWMIAIAGSILTVVSCFLIAGLYYSAERAEERAKYIGVASQARQTQRIAQQDRLMQEAHWETYTDAGGDLVIERRLKLPIDQAMQIIVDRHAQGASSK